ncbi:MAG: flagellar assembly protein FliW [Pirellulaceae bacterium]
MQLNALRIKRMLCAVSSNEEAVTANLRAPIVINLDRRLGCQVITTDEQSLQHEILPLPVHLRRTA